MMRMAIHKSCSREGRGRQCSAVAALAFLLALWLWTDTASAETINVSTTPQLEAAVANAGAGDTIVLAGGDYAPTAPLEVKHDLTISGPTNAPGARLDGSAIAKPSSLRETLDMFVVRPAVNATVRNVAVTTVSTDAAAFDVFGSLTLEGSLLSANNGTGVLAQTGSTVTIRDTTINFNRDGLAVDYDSSATLVNVTIAFNVSGISNGNGGRVDMTNTIVAGSVTRHGQDCVLPLGGPASPGSSTNSLDQDGSCAANIHANPQLGGLADNGGPTSTRGLIAGSPAIDAGSNVCPQFDQRGAVRIGACDIGAFEFGSSAPKAAPPLSAPSTAPGTQPSGTPSSSGSSNPVSAQNGAATRHAVLPLHLRGRGSLAARRGPATFRLSATAGKVNGVVIFKDARAGVSLRATRLKSVSIDPKHRRATVRGVSVDPQHRRKIAFTLVVTDASHDSLRITLSNGYTRNGVVRSGSVTIA